MKNENSLIDAAVLLLQTEKKPYDFYQLFDILTKEKELTEDEKLNVVTKFYTDLTTSAKFVYTGDNEWDLKANQKIELWEKDGSFYKEYTRVDLPDELKEPKAVKVKKVSKKAAKKEEEPVIIIQEAKVEPVVEAVTETVVEAVVEPVVDKVEPKVADKDTAIENYEEEVFEEFDEFDEDKYNEYMDTYEDKYDNKK